MDGPEENEDKISLQFKHNWRMHKVEYSCVCLCDSHMYNTTTLSGLEQPIFGSLNEDEWFKLYTICVKVLHLIWQLEQFICAKHNLQYLLLV